MNKYFKSKYICSNCRLVLPVDDLVYICHNHSGERNRYIKQPQFSWKFLKTSGDFSRCPDCKKITRDIVCPKCYQQVTTAPRIETISVAGLKSAGKTVYISALIKELNRYFREMGSTVDIVNYTETYRALRRGEELTAATVLKAQEPVTLHINKGTSDALDIIIYDIAGETLVPGVSETVYQDFKHLAMSSLIIYLFDPLQADIYSNNEEFMKCVKEHKNIVDFEDNNGDDGAEVNHINRADYNHTNEAVISQMTNQIAEIIKNECQVKLSGKLPIKIAPTISMVDTLTGMYSGNRGYFCERIDYSEGIPKEEQKRVDSSVKAVLKEWGESVVDFRRYSDMACFGVSSLGCHPDEDNKLPEYYNENNSINVINPVLWLLNKNKTMPKCKKFDD